MSTSLLTIRVENQICAARAVAEHNRRVAKLNRRHGQQIPEATIKNLGTRTMAIVTKGMEQAVFVVDLEISVEAAVIGSHQVCAVVSATDVGYLASSMAGASLEDLAPFVARGSDCDHCKVKRPRNTTYVLRDINLHIFKLVGSTCVKDFTGHQDPRSLIAYADMLSGLQAELDSLDDENGWDDKYNGRGPRSARQSQAVPLAQYLGFVRQVIRTEGWMSRAQAHDEGRRATANIAWEALENHLDAQKAAEQLIESDVPERDGQSGELAAEFERLKDFPAPEAQDTKAAEDDLALVEAHLDRSDSETETTDDFEEKIQLIVNQGYAFGKNIGMAAAICRMADRLRNTEVLSKMKASRKDEWMGALGKRETFTLKCVHKKVVDGDWGSSTLHVLVDGEGREAKWFSSGSEGLDIGTTYDLKGTVKKHDTYSNLKTTMLSRCKVMKKHDTVQAPG